MSRKAGGAVVRGYRWGGGFQGASNDFVLVVEQFAYLWRGDERTDAGGKIEQSRQKGVQSV